MANTKDGAVTFWSEMANVGLYKRTQGKLVRQLTALALGLIFVTGCYTLSQTLLASVNNTWIKIGLPVLLGALGCWFAFRVVNYPRFADFLISVEAEMDKVSWARKQELITATAVVIVMMVLMAAMLLMFDLFWRWFFELIGFLQTFQDVPPKK